MKKFYVFLLVFLVGLVLHAQSPFVTTWEVDNSVGLGITIPVNPDFSNYNYAVDFGDGTTQTNVTGDVSHTYSAPGVYTVSISGDFPAISFLSLGEGSAISEKIKTVTQWGDNPWLSMHGAFAFCKNLQVMATDVPDLSQVTSLAQMFLLAENFNQSIDNWDVSNVTNMGSMFNKATSFNQPLNSWNTGNVTSMGGMFWGATSFNQPIGNWDTSNVTSFYHMFYEAAAFNQNINTWDVSSLIYIEFMFAYATAFNSPLDTWDISGVTALSFVFWDAASFNQDISTWDVSNVTSFTGFLSGASSYNQPMDSWDVSNAANMMWMFAGANSFNQPLNSWDVSNVNHMAGMFAHCFVFNQPLDNWDVSSALYMDAMFLYCYAFNQDISGWEINTNYLINFLSGTALDIQNYDLLLSNLVTSGVSNGTLGSYGLEYCNSGAHDALQNTLGWTISGDSASLNCNTLMGNVIFDIDNNGCGGTDPGTTGVLVSAVNSNNDVWATLTNAGTYELGGVSDNLSVTLTNLPSYYTPSPATASVSFGGATTAVQDFCLTATQLATDLNVVILPLTHVMPGSNQVEYLLMVKNVGSEAVTSSEVTFSYDGNLQTYLSASAIPTVSTASSQTFTIPTLQPFSEYAVNLYFETEQPPILNFNDIITLTATVNSITNPNDVNPANNTYIVEQTVIGSFDPNDKQVLQGDAISIEETDEYLDYIIRFQNSGTANATYVAIRDTLDTKLDWTTLQPISASHDYELKITNGNALEFVFNGINLPYESADEPGSHGYVAFRVKPKSNVVVGDVISGEAAIYFDYNLPIITNTVATTIMAPLATEESVMLAETVKVYPNPASNTISVRTSEGVLVDSVSIYSVQGQLLGTYKAQSISVANLASGVYVLQIATNKGTVSQQLIKQ